MAAQANPAAILAERHEGLLAARCASLSARLPLLYSVILVNIFALASTFAGTAPDYLTKWIPLSLAVAIGGRMAYWLAIRAGRGTPETVRRAVGLLPVTGLILASGLVAWALALYGYGDDNQRSLVHHITAITCFAGILGMSHSPGTALAMGLGVIVPSSAVFLLGDHPARLVVVAVQAVVGMLLLLVARGHNRDFVALELSRQDLGRRAQEASELASRSLEQATRDALTGGFNRRGILDLFEDRLAQPAGARPWLALIDLDGFKLINDTHGHAAGDAVLCAVSERIALAEGLVASGRMGGDEFALLLAGELDRGAVGALLTDLATAIAKPIAFGNRKLAIRASIGLHHCEGSRVGDCLERADLALYRAKANHATALGEFTTADEAALADKRTISRVFTSSDLASQLSVLYQPVVDCHLQRTVGFEALVRWSPDGREWLSPHDFIHLAETTGRMSELTEMIVARALREFPAWEHGCDLSINLSGADILREDGATWLAGLVDAAGAPHRHIGFEITESALVNDYRRAADTLDQLRSLGFRIILDDFGTGYSSLSHVHNLPLDQLKIDRSFALGLVASPSARAIVGTTVALARQLDLDCIIEGIETAEQEAIARSLGLRLMQGFHFSRPVRALEALNGTFEGWDERLTALG